MGRGPVRSSVTVTALALGAAAAPWLVALVLPPLAQPQSYHEFADQRTLWGVPHALDVLSNLPFLLVGLLGLRALPKTTARGATAHGTTSPAARAPWYAMFCGVTLTALGSAAYHLDPTDATLVWDRLPMALGFAGLAAGVLTDRAARPSGLPLGALAISGIGSVVFWALSGNLAPYLAAQAGFLGVAFAATALIRSPYTHAGWLYGATALYAGALAAERLDREIAVRLDGLVSGHTLKHLLAAAAILVVYLMLRRRRRVEAATA